MVNNDYLCSEYYVLYMDTVKIKGYKSLRDITLKIGNVNLLIGANGAGKSNFLSFFELLGNVYERRLAAYVTMSGGVDKLLYHGRKETERIVAEITDRRNYYNLSLIESDGRLIIEHERLGYCNTAGYCNSIDIASYKEESGIKDYNGLERGEYIKVYLSQIRKFHFHDTGRRSPFTAECDVVNDSYVMYEHGENISAILYKMKTRNPMAYNRIVKVVQSIAPYFRDFYLQPSDVGKIRLQWQDIYSNMIYGPSDLSDGTIRFIALAVLFLQPALPHVIIIDEPELGLHPVAIEKLAGLIRIAAQKGTQIIVGTQSAELISNFTPEDVLVVDQNEEGTQIRRLKKDELQAWIGDYSLGDLWKMNIVKGGQPQ